VRITLAGDGKNEKFSILSSDLQKNNLRADFSRLSKSCWKIVSGWFLDHSGAGNQIFNCIGNSLEYLVPIAMLFLSKQLYYWIRGP